MKLIDRVGKYIIHRHKKTISLFKKNVIKKEDVSPIIYEGVTRNFIEKGISQ